MRAKRTAGAPLVRIALWHTRPMSGDITDVGHVSTDISIRATDGSVIRVAAVNDTVRLTITNADGMVTALLNDLDAGSVADALERATTGARRFGSGTL